MPRRGFPIGTTLFLLITGFTLLEIYVLILLIRHTGLLFTVALTLTTAALGAAMARHEGLAVMERAAADLAAGRLPTHPLLEGAMILVGGALLITPGLITDAIGLSILLPPCRRLYVALATRLIQRHMRRMNAAGGSRAGGFRFYTYTSGGPSPDSRQSNSDPSESAPPRRSDDDVIDAEFWEEK